MNATTQTFAVGWGGLDGPLLAGKAELGPTHLRLEAGAPDGRLRVRTLLYRDIVDVRRSRVGADRIRGRSALILEPRAGESVRLTSLDVPGAIREIFERIARARFPEAAA